MDHKNIERFLSLLPADASILDYGSYDDMFLKRCLASRKDCKVDACDIRPASKIQGLRRFIALDAKSTTLPIADASYDGIVLSHVLEHLHNPIASMAEILRILKPGGLLYVEAPSERSLQTRSHPDFARHGFFSFWDDPTHLRPWTPAALYRLAVGFACEVESAGYIGNWCDALVYPLHCMLGIISRNHHRWTDAQWRAKKFSCYALIARPATLLNAPEFTYVTFRKA